MAISWGTTKSILLLVGPILLPKAIAYYRSLRAAPTIHNLPIRPPSSSVIRTLLLLFLLGSSFFLLSLPPFSREDIFKTTSSRLQIPTDVLFTRLSALRPHGLTPSDEVLRSKINSLESRLLFLQYGPSVLTNCLFCTAEEPSSYLYYALPGIFGPHLLNLILLSFATNGSEGSKWRPTATIAAGAVALIEVYFVSTYPHQSNARALKLEDIDFFYAKMRVYRNILLSLLDIFIATLLYLSSTNRMFVTPPSPAESIEQSLRILDSARSKISATGILRNTINRDEELRTRSQAYWRHEVSLTGELLEDREVVDSVNSALENRLNIATISVDAATYAENVFAPLIPANGSA